MMSLTFGLFTQVSDSGPLGPLVFEFSIWYSLDLTCFENMQTKLLSVVIFAEKFLGSFALQKLLLFSWQKMAVFYV